MNFSAVWRLSDRIEEVTISPGRECRVVVWFVPRISTLLRNQLQCALPPPLLSSVTSPSFPTSTLLSASSMSLEELVRAGTLVLRKFKVNFVCVGRNQQPVCHADDDCFVYCSYILLIIDCFVYCCYILLIIHQCRPVSEIDTLRYYDAKHECVHRWWDVSLPLLTSENAISGLDGQLRSAFTIIPKYQP